MRVFKVAGSILSSVKIYNQGNVLRRLVCNIHQDAENVLSNVSAEHSMQDVPEHENVPIKKGVPVIPSEYSVKMNLTPQQPRNPHLLKVAILGEPNVGKSTLTNRLVKWKVCAVSKKVHTTRNKSAAIFVEDNKQIVFLDTPGFVTPEHSRKHNLEVSFLADPIESVREADLIAVIIDSTNKWTNKRIHEEILAMLDEHKEKKSVLILNKVDAQKKKSELLIAARILTRGAIEGILDDPADKAKVEKAAAKRKNRTLEEIFQDTEEMLVKKEKSVKDILKEPLVHYQGAKGWPFFSRVFMISALEGSGVDDLRQYLLNSAKAGDWLYHDSNVIDKHPYAVALMTVREVLLEELPDEVPYNLNLRIQSWVLDASECLRIHIMIRCPKVHYKSIVIGKSGTRIGRLVDKARQSLQDTFRSEIFLRLGVE